MNEVITNPIFVRALGLLLIALVALFAGTLFIRRLRIAFTPEDLRPKRDDSTDDTAFHAYQGLIARLKTQEQELTHLREEARSRAAASEGLSASVLTNLGSGVVVLTPAGIVQQANPAAREILGFASPTGLHARDLFKGIHGLRAGDVSDLFGAIENAAQSTAATRFEADYATPAGEEKILGMTVSPVRSTGSAFLGSACLISDLTEMTSLSRQMHLRENLASLGEMSAGIAHEFKNSLATISGYSQMLKSEDDPAVRDFATRIHGATENLARVVTDFLIFARPKALRWEPIEIRGILEDCGQETGVELDLSGFPVELTIAGDPTAVRQVFSNLLRNSAEATRPGIPARISAIAGSGPEFAEIALRDNGSGIPEDVLKNIFIPFFTTKSGGTGLGLALVHRIITEHGGSIRAANGKDGAIFTLSLPLRKPTPLEKATSTPPETR